MADKKNWFEKHIPLLVTDLKSALGDSFSILESTIIRGHKKAFRNGIIIGAALAIAAVLILEYIF